jgi:hypothetical protein
VKLAKYEDCGPDDVIVTVATDGADLYRTEHEKTLHERFGGAMDPVSAAESFGRYMLGNDVGHLAELSRRDRERIFNLGYYTWVEQQGVTSERFTVRRDQAFWRGLLDLVPAWDAMIREFNGRTGVTV